MVIKLLLPECEEENILGEDFLAGEEEVLNEKALEFRTWSHRTSDLTRFSKTSQVKLF